ncbi:GFA family protein [Phenylobacterium soli]|uniref:GFA family protein n=1 Tax=Phenylobacterium soli TaxID=2170551 RepID=A0A328AMI5_9CAUL|nr:GFA family protein [Phenylobacterium soli]RAK54634.1 GFA family protein [Phenylobacterium soli]
MIEASCHCGAVRLTAKAPPAEVTECNCSICSRLGARWAYYSPAEVELPRAGATQPYVWGDRMLAFHRCRACGIVTHWQSLDGAQKRMAINARAMPGLDWNGIRVRHFDGAKTWEYLD